MKKVALKLLSLSDATLLAFANTLHSNALSNPVVASSSLIPSLKSTKDDFAVSLVAAADKGRAAIAKKNQDRKLLESAIRLYASYVEDNITTESEVISLGFTVAIKRSSTGIPATPAGVVIADSNLSGSVTIRFKRIKNARVYQLRYSKTYGEDWNESFLPFTKTTANIQELEVGSVVWVQVRAINPNGYSEWSDPATMMVR
jgi:hypothetical protein